MNPTTLMEQTTSADPNRPVGSIVRDLLTTPSPTPGQVGLFAAFVLCILGAVVAIELVRRRKEQLARNRSRWDNFTILARQRGLDDPAIERMKEMHLGLDALHAPDAMLRIPAVYDRALDAWIATRGGRLSEEEWQFMEKIRVRLRFKGLSAETSLSHTRQIADGQEVRLATEDGHWSGSGVVQINREDLMVVHTTETPPRGIGRMRIAFSRQGDGEYKTSTAILGVNAVGQEIRFAHTDELLRQQLRMWVRVPVLIPGKMHRIIGPEGIPHPSQDFEVTLLDLSGGGAMVSSIEQLEVESRGLLDFMLGDAFLEGVRFVMLRTGKTSRSGVHVCHLCFENIDVQTQERIMRYVFERQRSGRIGS
jgi:hypothetical protein